MDNAQFLKNSVRVSRARILPTGLTYAQHLEVACRLAFGAESLNHFMANPGQYSASVPDSTLEVLHRIQRCELMFADIPVSEDIPGYERLEQWEAAARVWAGALQQFDSPSHLLWLLQQTDEIESLPLPMMMSSAGRPVSLLDPSIDIHSSERLRFVIGAWLPHKEGPGRSLLIQLWDQLEYAAVRQGLSEEDAAYFRSLCRESYNHGWSMEAMALLGVLDAEPDAGSFFERFGDPAEAVAIMKKIWLLEEPEGAP